jgi:hypothetical protein
MYMNPCQFDDARRGFFKKSAAVAALYLTPSVLVKTFAADSLVPMPIAKEKLKFILNGKPVALEIDASAPRPSALGATIELNQTLTLPLDSQLRKLQHLQPGSAQTRVFQLVHRQLFHNHLFLGLPLRLRIFACPLQLCI